MHLQSVENFLVRMFATRQAIELRSGPGIGKSSVVEQVAERLSGERHFGEPVGLITFILSTIEQPDVRGFMVPQKITNDDGTTSLVSNFSKSPMMPSKGMFKDGQSSYKVAVDGEFVDGFDGVPRYGIVFLDEFAQASHDVQKPAADLLLNKRIGQFALPDGWTVWAASNRTKDKAGVNKTLSFVRNRMMELEVEPRLDPWVRWATKAGVHPMVIAFAKFKSGMVFADTVPDKEGPFCTPRSLVFAGQALQALSDDPDAMQLPIDAMATEAAGGWIGEGAAAEMLSFMRVADSLPAFEDIVKDPENVAIPSERPDVMLAMAQMVIHKMDRASVKSLFKFVARLPQEFQVTIVQGCVQKDNAMVNDKAFADFFTKNQKLIMAANAAAV